MLYLLFLLSGISGLIYQVVWVRTFGNVFGNTVYSASIVVAVFMLGLGVGSYAIGAWADRRYAQRPDTLLRVYGVVELIIAALGLGISLLLPRLGELSAAVSSYTQDANGWFVLSAGSYVMRGVIAVALLAPITLLMGGTLTLLIRHLVRRDVEGATPRIAVLYAVNTAGAALGCLLTDFSLVPSIGLLYTQVLAVALNIVAGLGAFWLSASLSPAESPRPRAPRQPQRRSANPQAEADGPRTQTTAVAIALALIGFAALGLEILWFRHFTIMLGQFRAVFSLLLAIVLAGIGVGALISGVVQRRTHRPGVWLMAVQALFVITALLGLYLADARAVDAAIRSAPVFQSGLGAATATVLDELWFNARPMLIEVGVPALLMGFSFPLANAIVQRAESSVGRRAGLLYLANTAGAVAGSLLTGLVLLPSLGIQQSGTLLAAAAALAIVPLAVSSRQSAAGSAGPHRRAVVPAAACLMPAAAAVILWATVLPADHVLARALPPPEPNERVLTVDEGVNEVISVTELSGRGRTLMTNGHAMSSTRPMSQRYMRALAHVPLLALDSPRRALVIGFGVGNTTHAATLHPSMERVEVADLSRDVLQHATYFSDFNRDVLRDPRVTVYVNDGRQHLQMQAEGVYDLVTLEPPPIAYAGVASLYSREFYALAASRLREGGYMSQWLPAYQVPTETTLAMVRAFLDVFPGAVLLSGAEADLLLLGVKGGTPVLDPDRLLARLHGAPDVRADLARLDLGSVTEIAGMFVGSAGRMASATEDVHPVTDDRPSQEYGVLSLLDFGEAVPGVLVDLEELSAWCPRCFVDGRPAPTAPGLDAYVRLLQLAYTSSLADVREVRLLAEREGRTVAGSRYLGGIVPETAEVHNILGISLASRGNMDAAVTEFREALTHDPDSAQTRWHLGAALASVGAFDEAALHLRRAVELDPAHAEARSDLQAVLALQSGRRPRLSN